MARPPSFAVPSARSTRVATRGSVGLMEFAEAINPVLGIGPSVSDEAARRALSRRERREVRQAVWRGKPVLDVRSAAYAASVAASAARHRPSANHLRWIILSVIASLPLVTSEIAERTPWVQQVSLVFVLGAILPFFIVVPRRARAAERFLRTNPAATARVGGTDDERPFVPGRAVRLAVIGTAAGVLAVLLTVLLSDGFTWRPDWLVVGGWTAAFAFGSWRAWSEQAEPERTGGAPPSTDRVAS